MYLKRREKSFTAPAHPYRVFTAPALHLTRERCSGFARIPSWNCTCSC